MSLAARAAVAVMVAVEVTVEEVMVEEVMVEEVMVEEVMVEEVMVAGVAPTLWAMRYSPVSVTTTRDFGVPPSICAFCRRSLVVVERWGADAIFEVF